MTADSARTGARLVSADRVEGAAVFNRESDKLGHIDKIYIDKVSGQVEYATLAFGGVLGIGEKHHPLPWKVLTYDPAQEGFVVDLEKSVLEKSPSYGREHLASNNDWPREVGSYFTFE